MYIGLVLQAFWRSKFNCQTQDSCENWPFYRWFKWEAVLQCYTNMNVHHVKHRNCFFVWRFIENSDWQTNMEPQKLVEHVDVGIFKFHVFSFFGGVKKSDLYSNTCYIRFMIQKSGIHQLRLVLELPWFTTGFKKTTIPGGFHKRRISGCHSTGIICMPGSVF